MSTAENQTREGKYPEGQMPACPHCGKDAVNRMDNLRALGYDHNDVQYQCNEGHVWTHGKPRGEHDGGKDLNCDVCGHWGLVHFIALKKGGEYFEMQVKCPECYYLWTITREAGHSGNHEGRAHVGYPQVTGDVDAADPFPFKEDT